MFAIKSALIAMVITVYVPLAGGINGGGVTRSGKAPQTGMAACGWGYPFGTVFEIVDENPEAVGLPRVVECADRGGMVGNYNLDMALVSTDVRGDLNRARTWGRRVSHVRIYPSMDAYRKAKQMESGELGPQ